MSTEQVLSQSSATGDDKSSVDNSFRELTVQRSSIKGRITTFSKYLSKITEPYTLRLVEISELKNRLEVFMCLFDKFGDVQTRIELLNSSKLDNELAERDAIEQRMHVCIATARTILGIVSPSKSNEGGKLSPGTCHHHENMSFRLPVLQIPKFDGSYSKWLEFRDTFESLIHNNDKIQAIHKFYYLNTYLEGEAARIVSNIEVADSNYPQAWSLLCERYDNKRQLITNHLNSLLSFDPMTRESEKAIRFLVDHITKNLRALKTLGQPTDHWDTLVIHIMASKLDSVTSLKWEEHRNVIGSKEIPSLGQFCTFLKDRADVLESVSRSTRERIASKLNANSSSPGQLKSSLGQPKQLQYSNQNQRFSNRTISAYVADEAVEGRRNSCYVCHSGEHRIYDCPAFKVKSPEDRGSLASSLGLCLNCLRGGHETQRCKLSGCRICKRRTHNTLLHKNTRDTHTVTSHTTTSTDSSNNQHAVQSEPTSSVSMSVTTTSQVLLSTALVDVVNPVTQEKVKARALLDSGSQSSFITNDLKQRLKLNSQPLHNTKIVGIGNSSLSTTPQRCNINMKSRHNEFNVTLSCLVLAEITDTLPKRPINIQHLNLPVGIYLADPSFNEPSKIDMLIGADLFWDLVGSEIRHMGPNMPVLRSSKLGWLLAGPIYDNTNSKTNKSSINVNASIFCNFSALDSSDQVHQSLSRFWELEELPDKLPRVDSNDPCEKHFVENTKRREDGTFSVRLPLIDTADCLGDSYGIAKGRFLNLEKRFKQQPKLKHAYADFIREYSDLGHLSESAIRKPMLSFFLPHHAVLKEKSESTKLRVVFDASARTSSGLSVNDIQMVGKNIQDSLYNILIRFRQHKFVLCGDIEKMYRMVSMSEADRNLQLILWRDDPSQDIKTYRLNTVTYGFASASYLSTRCLWQLGEECRDDEIKTIIQNDFMVDDLITGADSEEKLCQILAKVSTTLSKGGFTLRKYRSNSELALKSTSMNTQTSLVISQSCDTLGLNWNPNTDTLHFPVDISSPSKITKRSILSTTLKLFDPLGLLSPCTIKPKMLIQKLWVMKLDWDEPVSPEFERAWNRFIHNLPQLSSLSIPRYTMKIFPASVELHCFCDASQAAYGACVYVRCVDQAGTVTIQLYSAKARVAPLKPTTIPRLELCGALLAARLSVAVTDALRLQTPITRHCFWTDSSVVLGWIHTDPSKLKSFVANRVVAINELTDPSSWRYVPTSSNPADLASRGIDPHQIVNIKLWWNGPEFLSQHENLWPILGSKVPIELPELKVLSSQIVESTETLFDVTKYSSFKTLQRILAYVFRFIHNSRVPSTKHSGPLSVDELEHSFTHLTKLSQHESFSNELGQLTKDKSVSTKSKISALTPFIDSKGIIRVGGRLSNSEYSFDKKHPILLCAKHHFTKLIFTHEHTRLLHAGPTLMLASIRERIWPIGGRDLARRIARSCVLCRRVSAKSQQNIMGNLPSQRLMPDFPFSTASVDFAGPFMISDRRGRGSRLIKAYLCLFICFRYKCVHLEAVSDMSKDAFILAFHRFCSRKGKPREMFCDNGRNFVAAAKDLGDESIAALSEFATSQHIKFTFSPAYAPNFNGLVEAGIKSAKYFIKRVIGLNHFNFEELSTLFAQIEAILNSRPLCPLSSSPDDLSALTPGHYLIGRALTAPPSSNLEEANPNRLNRYQRLEQVRQHFWRRWQSEYVANLQQRSKWRFRCRDLQPGDMVVLKEDGLAPLQWRLGRVQRVFPGKDGVPRVADVTTQRGVVRRALNRMCLLHENEDNEAQDS